MKYAERAPITANRIFNRLLAIKWAFSASVMACNFSNKLTKESNPSFLNSKIALVISLFSSAKSASEGRKNKTVIKPKKIVDPVLIKVRMANTNKP